MATDYNDNHLVPDSYDNSLGYAPDCVDNYLDWDDNDANRDDYLFPLKQVSVM